MTNIKKAELTAKMFINKNNLLSIPFDIKKAIKILNLFIMYDSSLEKLPAMTHTNKYGQKLITINSNYPVEQQRFSICHEISHVILGHKGNYRFLSQNKRKTLDEKCADACASELLMPRHKLPLVAYRCNYDVIKLKKIFYVSEKAMAFKLYLLKLPYKNTQYNFNKKISHYSEHMY